MTVSDRLARLLTHDFSPWANRYVYWLKTPLGVLLVAAGASLVCGLFVASQGLVVFAAIAGVIAMGIVWPWVGLRGVRCQLSFPQRRGREGDSIPVNLVVTNRWPWPVWGLTIEKGFLHVDDEEDGTAVALARIGPWSRSEFQWEFVPQCRGVYPKQQPLIASAFPFGFWKVTKPITVERELVVWPLTFELSEFPLPPGRQQWVASPSDHRKGDEGETLGTRPYRMGDSLRSVHWALTARYEKFIVCERQGSAQAQATVTVDADPTIHAGGGPGSTLEWSIRIAASVAESLLQQGTRVRLRVGERMLEAASGNDGSRRLLDFLARFDALDVPPSLSRLGIADRGTRPADGEFAIEVTTNLRESSAHRKGTHRITLNVFGFADREHDAQISSDWIKSWIDIDSASDVPAQLKRRWRQRSKEVWCGS